ncbi:hypothetical protein ABFG93_22485 (plasmid) [Pseudalkalibacillus hwajinpoensis]
MSEEKYRYIKLAIFIVISITLIYMSTELADLVDVLQALVKVQ